MSEADEIADYLLDNYGTCTRGPDCHHGVDQHNKPNGCRKIGWKGRGCPHWQPLGVTTYEQLRLKSTMN